MPHTRLPYLPSARRRAGFGLVEIMVALVIGMLAVIIMLQVFAQSEERKRIATAGGDAQTSGTIAFYQVQGDIAQAGFGLAAMNLFNCNLTWSLPSGANLATPVRMGTVTINPPANILPPGDANTDTLLVMYGSGNGQPQGNPMTVSGTNYTVKLTDAFREGDRVIAAPDDCTGVNLLLDRVTAAPAAGPVTVQTGASGSALFDLGQHPRILAYAIRGGNLTMCDYLVNDCGAASTSDGSIWTPVAANIVSMKAVYVKDTNTPMDGIPDPGGHDQTTPASACEWMRVSAINLALVARSAQFNKEVVNAPPPAWSDEDAAPIVQAGGVLGPNLAADEPWKHYRYRVFEALVPLRNVGWLAPPEGC